MKKFFTLALHHFSIPVAALTTSAISFSVTLVVLVLRFLQQLRLAQVVFGNYTILQTSRFSQITFTLSKAIRALSSSTWACLVPSFSQPSTLLQDRCILSELLFFKMSNFGFTACIFIFFSNCIFNWIKRRSSLSSASNQSPFWYEKLLHRSNQLR